MDIPTGGSGSGSGNGNSSSSNVPSNVYLLNVAFYSFAIFALGQMVVAVYVAKSQALIGDSAAMVVDSLTYLFNSYAERVKNKSLKEGEDETASESEREIHRLRRTRERLWLEILPPLLSVTTLIFLTFMIMSDATDTLFGSDDDEEGEKADAPNLKIMFIFSALNMALDVLNVTCFSRAQHALGFAVIDEDRHRYMLAYDGSLHNSYADGLKTSSEVDLHSLEHVEHGEKTEDVKYSSINDKPEGRGDPIPRLPSEKRGTEVNLNMCSAYTHVFADTLRSTAVLIAAGVAYIFQVGTPEFTDAIAALAVSIIILLSLGPLLRGIVHAWGQLKMLRDFEERMTRTEEGTSEEREALRLAEH